MKQKSSKKEKTSESKTSRITIILAVFAVIVIATIAGIAIYLDRIAPFRHIVLVVDDTSITMRYFLKRTLGSGGEPLAMLQTLINEEIIKKVTPKPPYNFKVTDEDIDKFARTIARGESDSISESDFKEWYRQQLNESRLSEAEFKELMRAGLLIRRLTAYLGEKIPTVAAQVHLNMIVLKDPSTGDEVEKRLKKGESFAKVARELSADEASRGKGGDVGWFPRAALTPEVGEVAFEKLNVGEISDPLYIDDRNAAIIMVSEKAAAREIDERSLRAVKSQALDNWLKEEQKFHKLEFHGFNDGYDTETDAWVQWQLTRMRRRSGGQK